MSYFSEYFTPDRLLRRFYKNAPTNLVLDAPERVQFFIESIEQNTLRATLVVETEIAGLYTRSMILLNAAGEPLQPPSLKERVKICERLMRELANEGLIFCKRAPVASEGATCISAGTQRTISASNPIIYLGYETDDV